MKRRMMHDEFREFARRQVGPLSIDDAAEEFERTHAFTPEYDRAARRRQVKVDLRKAFNEYRDEDGSPRLQSVLRIDPSTGEARPVYVQQTMFEIDDFKRQWRREDELEKRASAKKQKLERDFANAFPDERPLRQQMMPFDNGNGAGGHAA